MFISVGTWERDRGKEMDRQTEKPGDRENERRGRREGGRHEIEVEGEEKGALLYQKGHLEGV